MIYRYRHKPVMKKVVVILMRSGGHGQRDKE
jgi:hypothetical protein